MGRLAAPTAQDIKHFSKQAGVSSLQLVGNKSQFMSANQRGLLKN